MARLRWVFLGAAIVLLLASYGECGPETVYGKTYRYLSATTLPATSFTDEIWTRYKDNRIRTVDEAGTTDYLIFNSEYVPTTVSVASLQASMQARISHDTSQSGSIQVLQDVDASLQTSMQARIAADASQSATLSILSGGSITYTTTSSVTYTADAFRGILCDASGNAITIDLPAAATVAGNVYLIKKTDSSANTVTIDPNGGETIDGQATKIILFQNTALSVLCDGTEWWIW